MKWVSVRVGEIKFLHCADIHFDAPFTSLGADSGKSSDRRHDLKQTLTSIVDIAIKEQVDLLLICGDLYEHNYVKKSTIRFINDQFKRIPDVGIIIIPGNHDPYIANSYYKNFIWTDNVHILTEEEPFFKLEKLNVYIYGHGLYDMWSVDKDSVNFLMIHGTLDMNIGNNAYNPVTSAQLTDIDMDYIAFGHFHNRFEAQGANHNIFNPGSPEPLGFDEPGTHGVLLGTINKYSNGHVDLKVKFIELNRKTYLSIDIDISNLNTDEEVVSKLRSFIEDNCSNNYLLAVNLKGYIDKDYKPDLQYIHSCLKELIYFLKISDNTKIEYNLDILSREPGLRGLFVKKMLTRIDNADDKSQRVILEKALYYGLEALEKGEIKC